MTERKPRVGDIAHHKGDLDSRIVTRVEEVGGKLYVGLRIGTGVAWPCPARHYRFVAPKEES